MDQRDKAAWNAIMRIVERGETAEVRMTPDGIKVLKVQKELVFGQSSYVYGKTRPAEKE